MPTIMTRSGPMSVASTEEDPFKKKKKEEEDKDKKKSKAPDKEKEVDTTAGFKAPKKELETETKGPTKYNYRGFEVSREDFNALSGKGGRLSDRGQLIREFEQKLGAPTFTGQQAKAFEGEQARNLAELSQLEATEEERFLGQVEEEKQMLPPPTAIEQDLLNNPEEILRQKRLEHMPIGIVSELFGLDAAKVRENRIKTGADTFVDGALKGGLRLFGDVDIFGLSTESIIDSLTGRQRVGDLQSGVGKVGTIASTIKGTRDAGGISSSKAIAELQQLDEQLMTLEKKLQLALLENPIVAEQGAYEDVILDIRDQRTSIREAMSDVLQTEPSFDPIQLENLLEQLQAQTK